MVFIKWRDRGENKIVIKRTSNLNIALILVSGMCLSFGVGYLFDNYTNAQRPFADATTSVFSILASFMEAHKWLSSWVFWIAINAFSIWLYFDRELNFCFLFNGHLFLVINFWVLAMENLYEKC